MTFRSPLLLWLMLVIPIALLFLLSRENRREQLARRFASERLRGISNGWRRWRPALIAMALLCLLAALAGPQAGFRTIPIETREANRIVVLDVSLSMAAEDVGTSRLEAAKAIARRLIAQHGGRIALVVFESSAEIVAPLTNDTEAVSSLLDSVSPGDVDDPGSDLGRALTQALQLVDADPGQKADIIVLSDGEDQEQHLDAALTRLKQKGIVVSSILIGTAEGATIPLEGGREMLRDENGAVVTTRAVGTELARVARETGGRFYTNPSGLHAVDELIASAAGGKSRQKVVKVPIDRYQWPLSFAFAFLLLGSLAHRGAD